MVKQVFLLSALLVTSAVAQEPSNRCRPQMSYENHNQVDPHRLSLRELFGRVVTEVGEPAQEIGPGSGTCLGLFTEQDHRLVTMATADKDGRFHFGTVPAGKYRLVVRAESLCVANVPVQIVAKSGSRKQKNNQIVVHMRPAGIDTCSYADYK